MALKKTPILPDKVPYSGKIKPPIPTPRPKDEPSETESMNHLSHRSQNEDTTMDDERESRRNPCLSENIYESLDFRESIDVDSEDDNLPDILKHTNSTKSRKRSTTDEIYESLDHYQVIKIFNLSGYYLIINIFLDLSQKLHAFIYLISDRRRL